MDIKSIKRVGTNEKLEYGLVFLSVTLNKSKEIQVGASLGTHVDLLAADEPLEHLDHGDTPRVHRPQVDLEPGLITVVGAVESVDIPVDGVVHAVVLPPAPGVDQTRHDPGRVDDLG